MTLDHRVPWTPYGIALLAVGPLLAASSLYPWSGLSTPLMLSAPAVLFSAWYGGFGPGALATVLAAAMSSLFQLHPLDPTKLSLRGDLLPVGMFLLVGLVSSRLLQSLRRTRLEVEAARIRSNRLTVHLEAQQTVASILAECSSLREAGGRILESVCTRLEWQVGLLWRVGSTTSQLRCVAVWIRPGLSAADLEAASRSNLLSRGQGLPGLVWERGESVWLSEGLWELLGPRRDAADQAGIKSALAVPLYHEQTFLGVLELLATEPRIRNEAEVQLVAAIGAQMGRFISRTLAWKALRESEDHYRRICHSTQEGMLEHQRALEALRKREECYRLIARATNDVILDRDLLTGTGSWSGGVQEMLGYHPGELGGDLEWWKEHIHPDDRERVTSSLEAAISEGNDLWIEEYRFLRGDGTYATVLERGFLARDAQGRPLRMIAALLDLTERTRMESALRFLARAGEVLASSLDYHTTLVSVVHLAVPTLADMSAIHLIQENGEFIAVEAAHVDQRARRLWWEAVNGLPAFGDSRTPVARVLKSGWSELEADVTPEMLPSITDNDQQLETFRALSLRSYLVVPLMARDRLLGTIMLATSVSGRRYDNTELAVVEELARRAAVAIDNARLHRELQLADRRKEEFLAVLSHELRNPLAAISNAVYMLDQALSADQATARLRGLIREETRQVVRLVDDLLDVARITRGRIQLRREQIDLGAVVHQAVESERPHIEARRHELSVALPGSPVQLRADRTRLEQVLANLLNNAAEYTDPGGRIRVAASLEGRTVVIRVQDTGRGIPQSLLPRIFDLFMQGDRSLEGTGESLFIGLHLVKHLVELHDGTVEARSDGPGRGSEFIIRLPASSETGVREPATAPAEASDSTRPVRVLVVEDREDIASLTVELLNEWGHTVRVANDGPGAMKMALDFRPEVILLDIGLPGMSGYKVAEWIRSQPTLKRSLLVAVSGYGQLEDRNHSRDVGFDHHLIKPAQPEALRRLLESVR